jgi:hypothetical protein
MATAETGHGSYVSFWEEATWGTDVRGSGTQRSFDLASFTGSGVQYNRSPIDALASGSRTQRGSFLASIVIEPEIELFCTFKSMGLFFKHALGGTPATTGASAPYTHTFLHALTFPVGLTVEVNLGTSGESYVYTGCMIASMEVMLVAAEVVKVKLKLIGKAVLRDTSPTAASFVAGRDMTVDHRGFTSLTWGSLTAWTDVVQMATLKIDNKLSRRQRLGSAETARPVIDGFADFAIDTTLDHEAGGAILTAVSAASGTPGSLVLVLTDPTAAGNTITVTLHGAYAESAELGKIPGPSIMSTVLKMRGQSYGSDGGIAVVVTNDAAAALT